MSDIKLTSHSYGKDIVRVMRVVRSPQDSKSHRLVEYTVRCLLVGKSLEVSYTEGDNSPVVATDTVKNTINVLAKRLGADDVLCPERFAMAIASHFPVLYKHIEGAEVDVIQHKWSRIVLPAEDGGAHKHSFVRDGEEKRIVRAVSEKKPDQSVWLKELKGGIKELRVLKSSGSAFHGFYKDEYATLKPVNDRCFSTLVDCKYDIQLPQKPLPELLSNPSQLPSFCKLSTSVLAHTLRVFALDDSASVQATMYRMCAAILRDADCRVITDVEYALPNAHYIPIDLAWAGIDNLDEKKAEVFLPSAHPSGLIKARVSRTGQSKL